LAAPNSSTTDLSIATVIGAGTGKQHVYFPVVLAGLAGTAKVVDNYLFGFNGRILAVDFLATVPASTAAKAATITPSLDGTNLTGGVLALTTANCTAGALVSGTAVTAGYTFTPTSQFDLTLSSVTAFVEGSGVIDVTVINDDTLNAIAYALGGLRTP